LWLIDRREGKTLPPERDTMKKFLRESIQEAVSLTILSFILSITMVFFYMLYENWVLIMYSVLFFACFIVFLQVVKHSITREREYWLYEEEPLQF